MRNETVPVAVSEPAVSVGAGFQTASRNHARVPYLHDRGPEGAADVGCVVVELHIQF